MLDAFKAHQPAAGALAAPVSAPAPAITGQETVSEEPPRAPHVSTGPVIHAERLAQIQSAMRCRESALAQKRKRGSGEQSEGSEDEEVCFFL
jgi:hypothetical protein